jgi:hypothetical protein
MEGKKGKKPDHYIRNALHQTPIPEKKLKKKKETTTQQQQQRPACVAPVYLCLRVLFK